MGMNMCESRREVGELVISGDGELTGVYKRRCPGCDDCGAGDRDQFGDLT